MIAIDKPNIGSAIDNVIDTTFGFNTTQAVAANGFIVLPVGWFEGSTLLDSVSGGGLSWVVDWNSTGGTFAPRCGIASAQAPAGLAAGTAITITLNNAAPAKTVCGMSFTGVKTSSPKPVPRLTGQPARSRPAPTPGQQAAVPFRPDRF